jgi:alpha-acetolactate decarboxylase
MTTLEKFQELAKINFVESHGDIEIGTLQTADGYELYYIAADLRNLNWENEIYYYQPDFDSIMSAIQNHKFTNEEIDVAVYDIDDYFDEFYMLDWLQDNMDEDEFEAFTNE